MKFDLNDILITPDVQSELISRSQAKCKYDLKDIKQTYSEQPTKLISPVIVSPMDTVIDETNYLEFLKRGHLVCIPRGCNLKPSDAPKEYIDMVFFCYSLNDFKDLVNTKFDFPQNVLLDMANAHLSIIPELIRVFKSYSATKKIMVGNIANPETYKVLSEAGADYIRLSIGSGSACLTSVNTAIGYPMGSLISECAFIRNNLRTSLKNAAFIVADGGFREYSDIIKGLALGSNFIMVGSSMNRSMEACGDTYFLNIKVNKDIATWLFKHNFKIYRKFRGMSTKEVQRKWGNKSIRSSEGIVTKQQITHTLDGWNRNLDDYLQSCMSYCSKFDLVSFIGNVKYTLITQNAYTRFKK